MFDLGALPGGLVSISYGLNDLGDVVGYSSVSGGSRAFLYSSGTMTELGTSGGSGSENRQAIIASASKSRLSFIRRMSDIIPCVESGD